MNGHCPDRPSGYQPGRPDIRPFVPVDKFFLVKLDERTLNPDVRTLVRLCLLTRFFLSNWTNGHCPDANPDN